MGKRNLEEMTKKAYLDENVYNFLKCNHYLQWQKVVNKIVKEHFEKLKKAEK